MSIKYKMYQLKNSSSSRNGYWYARAAHMGTIETKQLAARISDRCTVTEADILAVISALVNEMSYNLKNGMRVKLDGFGAFKIAIRSTGVKEVKDFSVAKNIKRPHVIFQPETRVGADKVRVKKFVTGLKVEELDKYAGAPKPKKGEDPTGGEQAHP